jgi:serine/threonine-protein kinase
MEFTRKICAGLGAAHERGVLHRDLKPANIMIDGRGQPRITDFGLAGLAAEIPLSDLRSGTPAYMSPEQKAGREVTTKSDLYSLGLVMYEMFTGKTRKGTQSSPSEIVKDLDPAIERVILRCLEEDPKRRPSTALSVAMGLPGGDPIAAALAAGETPSPEMVAASQEKEGFSARTAVLCFVGIVLCVLAGCYIEGRTGFLARSPRPFAPDVLADRSQRILAALGYKAEPAARKYNFACCNRSLAPDLKKLSTADQDVVLKNRQPPLEHFWYREHRAPFDWADGRYGSPTETSPPNYAAGMRMVQLDAEGRLLRLQVQPWEFNDSGDVVDWAMVFQLAGLDMGRFTSIVPDAVPPMTADSIVAWRGSYAGPWKEPVVVRAASWRGKPVWFEVVGTTPPAVEPFRRGAPWVLVVAVPVLVLAIKNWRSGRADRLGALKISLYVLVGFACWGGPPLIILAYPLLTATLYLGTESYARRFWPDSLISWNRLLRGDLRNPLVASHLLVGLSGAVAFSYLLVRLFNWDSALPITTLSDIGFTSPSVLGPAASLFAAPIQALGYLAIFILFRVVLRKLWLADLCAALVFTAISVLVLQDGNDDTRIRSIALFLPPSLLWIALLRRFGYLSFIVAWMTSIWTTVTPLPVSGWMFERMLPAQIALVAVAGWATWVVVSSNRPREAESRV